VPPVKLVNAAAERLEVGSRDRAHVVVAFDGAPLASGGTPVDARLGLVEP
jgi:hypothetical protein